MATIAKEASEAHAARREAVGNRGGRPARLPAFSPKNFDSNPYLELQENHRQRRDRGVMWETSDD
jgi:hypothetical protein